MSLALLALGTRSVLSTGYTLFDDLYDAAPGLLCQRLESPPLEPNNICSPFPNHTVMIQGNTVHIFPPQDCRSPRKSNDANDANVDADWTRSDIDTIDEPTRLQRTTLMPRPFMQNFPVHVRLHAAPRNDSLDCDSHLLHRRDTITNERGHSSNSLKAQDEAQSATSVTVPPIDVLYAHVPDVYNLYHAMFDVIFPIAFTLMQHGLALGPGEPPTTQLVLGHDPTLTHALPWLDEAVGSNFHCTQPPFDMRGWQFLPYLQALTPLRPIKWVLPLPQFAYGSEDVPLYGPGAQRSTSEESVGSAEEGLNDASAMSPPWVPDSNLHHECMNDLVINAEPQGRAGAATHWSLPDPFSFDHNIRQCLHGQTVLGVDATQRVWALTDDYPDTPAHVPRDYPHRAAYKRIFHDIIRPQFLRGASTSTTHGGGSASLATLIVRGSESSRQTHNAECLSQQLREAVRVHNILAAQANHLFSSAHLDVEVVNLANLSLDEQVWGLLVHRAHDEW
eukprot:INCI4847.5.p1 GENE.INCI4847.5~~INCI4847.5.p1  ORF type:complete len:505 (-),score=64.73 INCI4847.5:287-1801(-)